MKPDNRKVILPVLFVIVLSFLLCGNAFAYQNMRNNTCQCDSCDDCTKALNDNMNCSVLVKLNTSITNQTGVCINNPENFTNKIFDCQGHTIEGKNTGISTSEIYSIILSNKQNNTIKNCIISSFYGGIYLIQSSGNTLTNNTMHSNDVGIRLYGNSNFNDITYSKIFNNTKTGILTDNCACVGFTCTGPTGEKGYTCYCTSFNCSNENGNSNNTIANNEISKNKIGIYSNASNSEINNNYVCGNTQSDFNSSDYWLSSVGDNNTCDKPDGWNDTGTTGCTYTCINCTSYNLDNNTAIDIFDVVAGLEYLSEGKEI